ncbi:HNH endonuclease signature motif containing protein [Rhodococcus sp. Eu-32]|uniref:HNH endonuclease signature motif containing protein n=1 Tax=Rhodococcus sp. Eu-32 TaxID=1017319 RepID=UPI001FB50D8E|nr:HNH endonuclease signature motif containing protein [Rhodococcus sp. Eu-32]
MGMPGGVDNSGEADAIRRAADAEASELLATLASNRRAENIAAATMVHNLHALFELRFCTEADIHESGDGEPDIALAKRTVQCEASVALSLSRTVTSDMMTIGEQLAWRLPAVDGAFTAGDIDYPRVRTIALVLEKASDDTVHAIEDDVLATALHTTVGPLRDRIWSLWIEHDPDEAAAARKKVESEERRADVIRGDDGMATLRARMSSLEGAEINAVLDELAGTVCSRDPRTKKQLRGYAVMALVYRQDFIACMCETDVCPVNGQQEHHSKRRPHLLQVTVDIETLLGLTDRPATLSDGTILDPDTARRLAGDSRLQMILTELIEDIRAEEGHGNKADESADDTAEDVDSAVAQEEHSGSERAGSENACGTDEPDDTAAADHENPSAAEDVAEQTAHHSTDHRPIAYRPIKRGRIHPVGPLSAALIPCTTSISRSLPRAVRRRLRPGRDVALSEMISRFLDAAAADPALAKGIHPDGHGGHTEPPPGALTYRPTAELVALTRATFSTCTFPGCSVPAAACEIDHIVPFDHTNPRAGGWTIRANVQPLCHFHHQAKTLKLWAAARLAGDAIIWTSTSGLQRITPSNYGTVLVPDTFVHNRKPRPLPATIEDERSAAVLVVDEERPTEPPPDDEPSDELYEPTWWEQNITDTDTDWGRLLNPETVTNVPTLGDIARARTSQERDDAVYLRERFLEHRAIVTARENYRPPPF